MDISEVVEIVERIAPPHMAAAWDRCGIQVASHTKDVDCIALCLDPTPESVRFAIAQGAQMIISHHPLLLKGRLPDRLDAYHEVLRMLFVHDVTLYAAHTSLDVSVTGLVSGNAKESLATPVQEKKGQGLSQDILQGPVAWLFRELDLRNGAVLDCVASDGNPAGFGLVGDMPKACTFVDILQCLQNYMDMTTATVCGIIPPKIGRIAYCAGSGSSLVEKALAHGADIFITGDVKYHSALESPLCMLDVGHHGLEEEMMRRFVRFLEPRLSGVRVVFVPSASPLRNALSCSS